MGRQHQHCQRGWLKYRQLFQYFHHILVGYLAGVYLYNTPEFRFGVDMSLSNVSATPPSVFESEGSADDLGVSNTTGSLTSSDVFSVKVPHDHPTSLDVKTLAAELNLCLGLILGVTTVMVVVRLFFLVLEDRIIGSRLLFPVKTLEELFIPISGLWDQIHSFVGKRLGSKRRGCMVKI